MPGSDGARQTSPAWTHTGSHTHCSPCRSPSLSCGCFPRRWRNIDEVLPCLASFSLQMRQLTLSVPSSWKCFHTVDRFFFTDWGEGEGRKALRKSYYLFLHLADVRNASCQNDHNCYQSIISCHALLHANGPNEFTPPPLILCHFLQILTTFFYLSFNVLNHVFSV